ncbi:protease pro-enzyme activation domain-containing protein [Fimbriimonas ginsengisoli]|uniref:Chitinase n=1 Tax=Fimbriimonas ginsengisoli Gsoil 348 TaxID=661478 RepID=A0A068NVW6_FIMGI|nr:protease pro-enzyme activation domain-containing protein [Fimbriimonas ginsengisoli]AIE87663.1 Chitinase [Fimbriimonas ginsengisoli Gsoil 348]
MGQSTDLGHSNPQRLLHVSVSLPLGNSAGLEAFCDSVSNPKSPNYRQFITPEEVGRQFGVTQTQMQKVVDFLSASGFKIKQIGANRMTILADCTVAQAEAAFKTSIHDFNSVAPGVSVAQKLQSGQLFDIPTERHFSFTKPLTLPTTLQNLVIDVAGLEDYTRPQPRVLTPTQTRGLYGLANMYAGGSQGQGRTIAISNFDGYRLSNVPLYYSQYSLPTPAGGAGSNITVKTISGGAGSGTPQGEGDLDIQMVLGMAPLCNFEIYDGGGSDLIGTLTREVNDNTADVISESYGWNLPASTATSAHNLHLSMTAQGITYMAASGDSGTTLEPYSYPDYDPEVLMVGGSIASVNASNQRTSEVGWSLSGGQGGGGGWSTNTASFNVLPSWQHGTGVPTNINKRLVPDVALNAAGSGSGAYYFYLNGTLSSGYVGTSFASPVFAGSLGVAEQNIIAQGGLPANGSGKRRFGRIQDLIYSQNGRSDVWFDITSGNNGNLPNGSASNAGPGWDFVTGFGAINFGAFVTTQVSVTVPAAPTGLAATAGNAQASLTWTASAGATSYNVKRATTSGGPYTTVGSPTTTSFTNTGLTNGTTYYYVVTAVNSAGESGNSNQASATPNVSLPAAPTGLTATAGNAQASLTWTASTGATSYNVKRATTSGGPYSTVGSSSTTSFTNTGLTNGTTYYYVVTAVNSAGESGNSNQATATPSAGVSQQLLLNPGFESGAANWTMTSGVLNNTSSQPAHGGSYDAWMCGYGSSHTDSVYQTVTIPSNVTSATLTFWVHIDTAETTTSVAYDTASVQIRNSSNSLLTTLATYSNLNKATGYVQKSFDVSAYKGQTIRVYVTATEDASLQTSFVFDDFALTTH